MSNQLVPIGTASTAYADHYMLPRLDVVPLVPEAVLRRHKVYVPTDLRFRSAARLLQALWRKDRNLSIGSYIDGNDKRHKLGSRLAPANAAAGANFLSPAIVEVVRRSLIFREIGALFEVERLTSNLLSSMPLTFNLFAALKLDLDAASRFIATLLPGTLVEVEDIRFEHSPGRGNALFTGDYTAFDVIIRGRTLLGQRGFIAVEVKYSEGMFEPAPGIINPRHFAISNEARLFVDLEAVEVSKSPYQQLFREHCLAQSMLDAELYDVGWFMLIGPSDNHLVQNAAKAYADCLDQTQDGVVRFVNCTLEECFDTLVEIGDRELGFALSRRYTDFHQVAGEIELSADPLPTGRSRARAKKPAALPA